MKTINKSYLIGLLCLFGFFTTQAQQIIEAEYFIDTDPGVGNGTEIPIAPGENVEVSFTAEFPGLEIGFHNLSARFMDENGTWTLSGIRNLYFEPEAKTGQIIAAEYFFDTDPGVGNGILLSLNNSDTLDLVMDIPVPVDMEFGNHRLYFRTQSTDGLWSHYTDHYFIVCTEYGPLAEFDYTLSADRWVAFEDLSQNTVSILWDFDDGTTDTATNPVHQFEFPGIYNVKQYATNDCGTDTLETEIVIRGIFSVETNKGSSTGSVMLNVNGFGFTDDAELSFSRDGYSPILPDTFNVQSSETINARFDLQNKETGFWNVSVDLPGDTSFVLAHAFEIVESGAPDMQVTVIGRSRILVNRSYDYHIVVSNNGFEDAVGIPLVIRNIIEIGHINIHGIDKTDMWSDPFYSDLLNYVQINSIDSNLIDFSTFDEINTTTGAAFVIPYVPAGSSLNFTISFFMTNAASFTPEFLIAPQGYLTSTSLLTGNPVIEPINCRGGEFRSALEMVLDTIFEQSDWDNCFDMANINALEYLRDISLNNAPGEQLIPYQGLNGVILNELASCILTEPMDAAIFVDAMTLLNERFNTLDLIFENSEDCDALSFNNLYSYQNWKEIMEPQKASGNSDLVSQIFNPVFSPMKKKGLGILHCFGCANAPEIDGLFSMDPNEKNGPGNNPYNNYLNGTLDLSYSIHFENMASATAAAGRVKIVDTLDAEKYDLASFEFGAFGFNESVFTGTQENYGLLGIYDLRPERPVYLKMEAFIDTVSGYTEFVFESLDTLTLQLTDDPDAGFLLPNVNHPEGEGFVSFTINLKNDLASGNEISNQAEIYFDTNEPIITNIWTNIYDIDLPESNVVTLPDTVFTDTFTVEWDGFDATSGIKYSDIYALTIEGADTTLAIWKYHISETNGEFTGTFGETYYFYSIATDNAGNIEPGITEFDAQALLYNPCWDSVLINQYYEICFGDSVMIEGNWQYEPGIYYDTLSTIYGCDSIIESELTVLPLLEQPEISWDEITLSSSSAETYQWYLNDVVIEGATNQTFVPAESGLYKVEISDENGCTAISDNFEIFLTGITNLSHLDKIEIFPNPTNGILNLVNLPNEGVKIEVYSVMGQRVFQKKLVKENGQLNLSYLKSGVYYLRIISDNQIKERKIIVN